jgi:hypothetical protein
MERKIPEISEKEEKLIKEAKTFVHELSKQQDDRFEELVGEISSIVSEKDPEMKCYIHDWLFDYVYNEPEHFDGFKSFMSRILK